MLRERVSEDIFVFTSQMYAQVTAGVILTSEGVIVVDTLPFPQEARELLAFVQERSERGVRYVVNTHSHADHVYGNYLFPQATVVAHKLCRQALRRFGEKSLRQAKEQNSDLAEVRLRLPSITFEGDLTFRFGGKTVRLMLMPGHTSDSIGVYVKEDKVLFAGDAMMPVPYIVWGNREEMIASLRAIGELSLENVVQGHGEILLRGEIKEAIETNIAYLEDIYDKVKAMVEAGAPKEELATITIEKCGKSRIPLNGLVQQLHQANLYKLYDTLSAEMEQEMKMQQGQSYLNNSDKGVES